MSERIDQIETGLEQDRQRLKETIAEIEERLTPGRLIDAAFRRFDTGPGEFANTLGRQIQAQPLPALLTGIGLAWLMAGSRGGAASDEYDSLVYEDYDVDELCRSLENAQRETVRAPEESDSDYQMRLALAHAEILGCEPLPEESHSAFSERVGAAVDQTKRAGASARRKMGAAAREVRNAAGGAAQAVGATAKGAVHGAEDAGRAAVGFQQEHPLAAGAVGLAVGALIGSLTPLSRQEHDALKGLADEALAKGADAANAGADRVYAAAGG